MSAGSPGDDNGGEPTQPAPSASEPGGFASAAPAEWSAPAEWTAPTPTPAPDSAAAGQPAGNGFSPAGADPWPAPPPADPAAGGYTPPTGQYGYPPAGQYGYPPAGTYSYPPAYYTPTTQRTNPVAIAALVCGLVQFPLGLFLLNILLAIPAIICGAIGLRQTRERGEGGRGLAIAGLVLGILGIVYFVIVVVVLIIVASLHASSAG